jgi:hypothetical protein
MSDYQHDDAGPRTFARRAKREELFREVEEAPRTIDLDRGVMAMWNNAGEKINMYLDNPGVYLNDHGQPVSERAAQMAGFDTVHWGALRRKQEALTRAMNEVTRLHEMEMAAIREKHGADAAESWEAVDPAPNSARKAKAEPVSQVPEAGRHAHRDDDGKPSIPFDLAAEMIRKR